MILGPLREPEGFLHRLKSNGNEAANLEAMMRLEAARSRVAGTVRTRTGRMMVMMVLAFVVLGGVVTGCQEEDGETAEETGLSQETGVADGSAAANSITTTGSETTLVSPDEAVIYVTVETRDEEAAAAVDQNAKQMKKVITRLEQEQVPEEAIETSNVTVNPEGRHDPNTGRLIPEGYRATNTVKVTLTDLERVGTVFSAAVDAGANNVRGPEWRLADDSAPLKEALKKAAQVARAKAEALAEAEGVQVGDVLMMREESASVPPRFATTYQSAMDMAAMPEAAPVNPQDLEVRASVIVTYRLER